MLATEGCANKNKGTGTTRRNREENISNEKAEVWRAQERKEGHSRAAGALARKLVVAAGFLGASFFTGQRLPARALA